MWRRSLGLVLQLESRWLLSSCRLSMHGIVYVWMHAVSGVYILL